MDPLLTRLTHLVSVGKINRQSPFPADLRGQDGAAELTAQALLQGISAQDILNRGLLPGMNIVGERFSRGEVFISNMLIAAEAMKAATAHLQPYYASGEISSRGTIILGTVQGDLHDIGKNLVKMIMQGDGWDVIDLGTDVSAEAFLQAVDETPGGLVGLSALLTTTMLNMETVTAVLRKSHPDTSIFIGGAPVSKAFCEEIGATAYFREPHSLARSLRSETNVEHQNADL